MSPQNYPYTTAPAPRGRHTNSHSTSSAFSSSANPDEDWTKISDLAERRRIQNRIAQRNYRKKLKKRLEDLERRAGSSSVSPPQTHVLPQTQGAPTRQHHPQHYPQHHSEHPEQHQQYPKSPEVMHRHPSPSYLHNQYTPPMEDTLMFASFEREGSRSPLLFTYHQYHVPEENMYPPCPPLQSYRAVSAGAEQYGEYLPSMPVTLPSMTHFHGNIKQEEDTMSPCNMSYHAVPNITYDESTPHTPPLSHSYQHSTCSELAYQYPSTPLSMPPSPRMLSGI